MLQAIKLVLKKFFPNLFVTIKRFRFETFVLPKPFIEHIKRLDERHLAIDLGANNGLVTETIARRGARVISFEPNLEAYNRLEHRASKYTNIEVHNKAAGVKNRKIKLYLHKNTLKSREDLTQASSLLADKYNLSSDNYEEVEEIDFASFILGISEPIELIKIDIEGYEIVLLNDLLDKNALDNVSAIYVETHENKIQNLLGPTEALKKRILGAGLEDKFYFDWH